MSGLIFTKLGRAPTTLTIFTDGCRLQRHDTVRWRGDAPRGVPGIDHERGGLDDVPIVELRVVGQNHDTVGAGQLPIGEVHRLERVAVEDDRRHVGIGLGVLSALLLMLRDYLSLLRLASLSY